MEGSFNHLKHGEENMNQPVTEEELNRHRSGHLADLEDDEADAQRNAKIYELAKQAIFYRSEEYGTCRIDWTDKDAGGFSATDENADYGHFILFSDVKDSDTFVVGVDCNTGDFASGKAKITHL